MKIIFAVIKSALVGGGIVGGCYGTYKFVESVKDVKDGEGINIFQSITEAYKTASDAATGVGSADLTMIGHVTEMLNNKEMVETITKNMESIKKIIADKDRLELFMKILQNCNKTNGKDGSVSVLDNCKDLSSTLQLIAGDKKNQKIDAKMLQTLTKADPEKVATFLATAKKIDDAKTKITTALDDIYPESKGAKAAIEVTSNLFTSFMASWTFGSDDKDQTKAVSATTTNTSVTLPSS